MFIPEDFSHLLDEVAKATTNHEKGSSFENLCRYIFASLDGIEVVEQDINMTSEEIDLVLWNPQIEDIMRPWDNVILVECKNWNGAVGAIMLDNFIGKLRRRHLKTGIFIAARGVSGSFIHGDGNEVGAIGIIIAALQEGIRVITITFDELQQISSTDDIKNLIKHKYCGLFVHKLL
jgi:hypothetical protein